MAKKAPATEAPVEESKGQGRAVVLPNGEKRIDFIRNAYYKDGTSRSDIRKAVNALYGDENTDGHIPYQIVFAATKVGVCGEAATDPRLIVKEPKPAPAADAK